MTSKMLLLKSLKEWKEQYETQRDLAIKQESYGLANYMDGKIAAYSEIIDILEMLKRNEIPFDLN